MPSLTHQYTAVHNSLRNTSREFDVKPIDVRVLVAIDELGPKSMQELANVFGYAGGSGAIIRRSVLALRAKHLVITAAREGKTTRPGVPSIVRLTATGRNVTDRFRENNGMTV